MSLQNLTEEEVAISRQEGREADNTRKVFGIILIICFLTLGGLVAYFCFR